MAAPDSKTLQSLSGKWKLNKDLSDDFAPVLELQGVNAVVRKATSVASVHLQISQISKNELQMEQTATAAAIPGTTEHYILDWEWRKSHDAFFGDIEGRSRWISQDDARKQGASGRWLKADSEDMLINAVGKKPDDSWIATHFWGFEDIGGARRHTRRVKLETASGEELNVCMVYDFEGQ